MDKLKYKSINDLMDIANTVVPNLKGTAKKELERIIYSIDSIKGEMARREISHGLYRVDPYGFKKDNASLMALKSKLSDFLSKHRLVREEKEKDTKKKKIKKDYKIEVNPDIDDDLIENLDFLGTIVEQAIDGNLVLQEQSLMDFIKRVSSTMLHTYSGLTEIEELIKYIEKKTDKNDKNTRVALEQVRMKIRITKAMVDKIK